MLRQAAVQTASRISRIDGAEISHHTLKLMSLQTGHVNLCVFIVLSLLFEEFTPQIDIIDILDIQTAS
jgi:hypothetical protein